MTTVTAPTPAAIKAREIITDDKGWHLGGGGPGGDESKSIPYVTSEDRAAAIAVIKILNISRQQLNEESEERAGDGAIEIAPPRMSDPCDGKVVISVSAYARDETAKELRGLGKEV